MDNLDSYNFPNEDLSDTFILSATCSKNDSTDSEWYQGAKHEDSETTDSESQFFVFARTQTF